MKSDLSVSELSLSEKIDFFTEFYSYIKSAIALSTALTKITQYSQSNKTRLIASGILKMLDAGEDFSVCILKFKKQLGSVYCNLLAIGAQAGELPTITGNILNSLKVQRTTRNTIIKACTYPAIMLGMLFLSVLILLFFIVPRISSQVEMLTGNVPPLLSELGVVASLLSKNWILLIALIVFFLYGALELFKKFFKGKFILGLPILGRIVRNYNLSTFAKIFSISYMAGVPVTSGILLSAEAVNNEYIKNILFKCSAMLSGKRLSESLASTGLFDPQMISKIETGEMTGNLDQMLNEISLDIDELIDTVIASAVKLIEPILMLIIGGFVIVYGLVVMGATNPFMYM